MFKMTQGNDHISPEALLALLKARRSIRRYRPDPIPDEYVDKIIEVARWAPSGANSQPWQFIVVTKEEFRKKIFEIYQNMEEFTQKKELERKIGDKGSSFKYFQIAGQFLRECKVELKKVKWPTRKELFASTAVVIVLVLLVALFLGLIDVGLIRIIKIIVG